MNRLRCLDITLKGLSATVPSAVPIYISNDGTKDRKMIRYLQSSHSIKLDEDNFPDSPVWTKQMGRIPNHNFVTGIDGKVKVTIHKTTQGIKNFTNVVRTAFKENSCRHVIKIQDDVIFKQGWYQEVCRAAKNTEYGLISGFRHFFDNPTLEEDGLLDKIVSGYIGGVMLIISRTACKKNPILWSNNIIKMRDMDEFWVDGCRQAGMAVGALRQGVCQHIGFKSEVYEPEERTMLRNGVILRCDKNLFPPFEIAKHVKKFG